MSVQREGRSSGVDLAITVGFSTTNKLLSRAIRWITRAQVSHAWIAFNDATLGLRFVMQAEAWGYELRPWERWKRENRLVAEFSPTGPGLEPALCQMAGWLGSRYDYSAALFVGIKAWISRLLKGRVGFRYRNPTRLMCSEAVVRFLAYGNYQAVTDLDPETTSPDELLKQCQSSPTEFIPCRLG